MIFLAELAFKSDRLLGWKAVFFAEVEPEGTGWLLVHGSGGPCDL